MFLALIWFFSDEYINTFTYVWISLEDGASYKIQKGKVFLNNKIPSTYVIYFV